MRNEKRFSLHDFNSLEKMSFSKEDYSNLKFGSDIVAKSFGYELANAFFEHHSTELLNTPSVVIPSPYNHIRNAATIMAEHFINRLNHLLITNGGVNAEWSVIHRKVSYIHDYGFLDKSKRKELIDGDKFHINRDFLENKNIIFIDDICITGTHEQKLIDILDTHEIKNNTFFLYFAKYTECSSGAAIEGALNFSSIKNVHDFIKLTKEKNHHLIVRPIKFLMNQQNEDFKNTIHEFNEDFIQKLYYSCIGEGYHKVPNYNDNFQYLSEIISKY